MKPINKNIMYVILHDYWIFNDGRCHNLYAKLSDIVTSLKLLRNHLYRQ
jgi:hypothetical protein